MTGDAEILTLISNTVSNTYLNKLPQSVKLDEATPKVLIKNITHLNTPTKDNSGREEFVYRIEVIGSIYANVSSVSEQIKNLMVPHSGTYIYLVTYENGYYDTNETAEIHRVIKDYRAFIKY